MQFQLNHHQHSSENIDGPHQSMKTKENWVKHFSGQFDPSHFKEIDTLPSSDATHAGLIYYLHLCWAKEIGACLRPDMFWYTIVSEIAKLVLDNSDDFQYLFSDSSEKQDIVILTNNVTDISIETLIGQMKNVIKNTDFLATICGTRFDSEALYSNRAILMTFACMATPYFNYMSTMCGIPHLKIEGTKQDWQKLYQSCSDLSKFQPKKASIFGLNSDRYLGYIKRITNLVGTIIFHCFGDRLPNTELINENRTEFFNNIFHYGNNIQCGSGHDDTIVQGWIKDLYFSNSDRDLNKFNTHINYVPYANIETKRMFCQATGLTYSINNQNTLHAQYGLIKYEVLNIEVFNKLAKK